MNGSYPAWKAALALGSMLLALAACAPQMASPGNTVGNFVWMDSNGNGLQEPGEPGVAGVTVRLLDAGGGILQETTTDADGMYDFPKIEDGEYSLLFSPPAGMGLTLMDSGQDDELDSDAYQRSGETDPFSIKGSDADLSRDAGLVGDQPQPTQTPAPTATVDAAATPAPAALSPEISTTYEHTVPGSYSEIIVQIDNLDPGQEVSGLATGPNAGAVDGDGMFSATADDYGTTIARIKIYQFGDYLITIADLDLSSTVKVTAEEPSSS
ncbi:MAG: SdrD B-like domain-containing protein [Anaerolineales bacterium]